MSDSRLQRRYLRAKLNSHALYVDGDHVFKAKIMNISQGGVLLSELPHVPEINALPVALAVVDYPRFQNISLEQIGQINLEDLPKTIVKTKLRMVRSFANESAVDKVFVNFIGCEFYNPSNELVNTINHYVENYTKNTVYLLSLFESLKNKPDQIEYLRKLAHLMGYDRRMKLPLLRAKVLHDYQSLESL